MAISETEKLDLSGERRNPEIARLSILEMLLIGMICGTIAAALVYVLGASLVGIFLAYGIVGILSVIPVLMFVLARRTKKCSQHGQDMRSSGEESAPHPMCETH
jgi:Flp pilus assembly protein TadB